MTPADPLSATIADLVRPGRGILAADESGPTITKRFTALGIESTETARRDYRAMLVTAPEAEQYLARRDPVRGDDRPAHRRRHAAGRGAHAPRHRAGRQGGQGHDAAAQCATATSSRRASTDWSSG